MSDANQVVEAAPEVNLGRTLRKPFDVMRTRRSIFSAFLAGRAKRGGKTEIMVDGDGTKFTYNKIVQGALALGHNFKKFTARGENVGVLLPTGAGAVITYFAVTAYGRVPAMLNFTAGNRALAAACEMSEIKTVLTAHKFIKLGGYEDLIKELSKHANIVYLEDVKENMTLGDKIAGGLGPFMPWAFMAQPHPDTPAVILYTSGTEGDPKGVVLSHSNLVANVEQVRNHIDLYEGDALFNPLPTFHSFGLTAGCLVPLILGMKTILHPSPLQTKEIIQRIKRTKATILIATDTFMSQYARAGATGDLDSLRIAICAAERIKDETRQLVRKKYSIELLEGYGATEAAPVISANHLIGNRPGTVGVLMASMKYKLEDVPGIDEGGRLYVAGPNIMMGYLKTDKPGIIQAPEGGWHDTGDIVTIDDDGFFSIRGRVKRFAKVGGEMVSLAVVENCATSIWEEHIHAAIAIPDKRKGEQIILLSACKDANRADLVSFAKNHGVAEIAVPKQVLYADEIPILGTGKMNYGQVLHIVEGILAAKASPTKAAPEVKTEVVAVVEVVETLVVETEVVEIPSNGNGADTTADDDTEEDREKIELNRTAKPTNPDGPLAE